MKSSKKQMTEPKVVNGKIINFYETMDSQFLDEKTPNPNFYLHHFQIPFRMCIVAPSGSGKSNFITNLIHQFSIGKGTFAYISIICKDKSEPLYKFLASKSDQISIKEGLTNLPDLDKFDKEVASLVIIDDCQLEKNQDRICEYYIRCRKKNVSIAYLAQNYFKIPIVVRNNCNYLVLLRISGERELNIILKEHGLGLTKSQLLNMYDYATDTKFNPLIIDIEATDKNHKYRKGFNEFLAVDNFQ